MITDPMARAGGAATAHMRAFEAEEERAEALIRNVTTKAKKDRKLWAVMQFTRLLRRQGFIPTNHFLQRFMERWQGTGVRIDPTTFARDFRNAQHYRDARPDHNNRYAVVDGVPIVYNRGGRNGRQIVLISALDDLKHHVPAPMVSLRESEDELEGEFEAQYAIARPASPRRSRGSVPVAARARRQTAAAMPPRGVRRMAAPPTVHPVPAPMPLPVRPKPDVPIVRNTLTKIPRFHIGEIKPHTTSGYRAGRGALYRLGNFEGTEALVTYDAQGNVYARVYNSGGMQDLVWQGKIGTVPVPAGARFGSSAMGVAVEPAVINVVSGFTKRPFALKHPSATGPDLIPL